MRALFWALIAIAANSKNTEKIAGVEIETKRFPGLSETAETIYKGQQAFNLAILGVCLITFGSGFFVWAFEFGKNFHWWGFNFWN